MPAATEDELHVGARVAVFAPPTANGDGSVPNDFREATVTAVLSNSFHGASRTGNLEVVYDDDGALEVGLCHNN